MGGVPSVNHPNFVWSLTADDLAGLQRLRHFEIYNGHPSIHNGGGGGRPSLEEMWDDLLTRGVRLYGVAVDDAHHFKAWGPRQANPGRGWIMVRAAALARGLIREAYERGDFYASSGVYLDDLSLEGENLSLKIRPEGDTQYTTYFVARGGQVVARDFTLAPSCALKAEYGYLRARVVSSLGECAWTQPVFID
jgi:hypothetical protein